MIGECQRCLKEKELIEVDKDLLPNENLCAECLKEHYDSADINRYRPVFELDDYERLTNSDRN